MGTWMEIMKLQTRINVSMWRLDTCVQVHRLVGICLIHQLNAGQESVYLVIKDEKVPWACHNVCRHPRCSTDSHLNKPLLLQTDNTCSMQSVIKSP
ncbi:hypothetical protein AVEN_220071-1 [Araneus ventricosus]|uniref:Uncharacterized protein n=1 Tax=Araneus ventricosus TaxID=182803 RepID=A0A4Y2HM28_ARAVE|nr:hypothetical protein AVEN_220071-1 [Araneus ventricosus]